MRIALVTETFPPEVNGVAMTLKRLVDGLAARGHHVQIVRPRQHRDDDSITTGQLSHVTVPGVPIPKYNDLKMGLPCKGRLVRLWRDGERPDAVHIATEGPLGASALWAARKLGIPTGTSFHTNFHSYGRHYGYHFATGMLMKWFRYLHNGARYTMVPSLDVQEALSADGFTNVMVLSRGVDGVLFSPSRRSEELRRQWGVEPDDMVVAYVGRVAAEKNIPLAVRAFEAMKAVQPRAKLVIVGDGPYRAKLEKEHPEYVYAGMRKGDDLAAHYASADAFVFASTTETFGNVVTEAMASGLCVLTYDYAAGRQQIQSGVNGVTVPLHDEAAFVAAAEAMATDLDQIKVMGAAARITAAAMTWDAIIEQFERKLADIVHA
jgi:glycosyltransferase involved in cell wall biosynthesis